MFMHSYFYVNHKIIFEYCAAYSALNKARPFCVSEQGKGTTKCAYKEKKSKHGIFRADLLLVLTPKTLEFRLRYCSSSNLETRCVAD